MGIRFVNGEGRQGSLDVGKLVAEQYGPDAKIIGVKQGIINIKLVDGTIEGFALGHWAQEMGVEITYMDGFNTPETALKQPPNGLNYFDQAVFYQDGMDMDALQDMFPHAQKNSIGDVVVLDNDGLWKTMWESTLRPPQTPPSIPEQIEDGTMMDPNMLIRHAGVQFLCALGGIDAETNERGFKVNDLIKALKVITLNCPHENKFQIGKLLEQTTGLQPHKFLNALQDPKSLAHWLTEATKATSFQYRSMQMQMAEKVVEGMRMMAMKDFQESMDPLESLPETKKLIINLAEIMGEFVKFLVGLDLLRDISRQTGLQEWVSISESAGMDPNKMPEMPKFVEAFVRFLRIVMPITEKNSLAFAHGKKGFKSIIHIMNMIDECIYSLAGVPDSSAKYKMFMALKKVQTRIETKLAFLYQPDPLKDRSLTAENPFMQAKGYYMEKRERLYKMCQLPREAWNNTLLEYIYGQENLDVFYDTLPKGYSKLLREFATMDTAYDMQPWVDYDHAVRTHDAFSEYHESFGMRPPEAGYLAKNSPRACETIAQALIAGATAVSDMDQDDNRNLLRNPFIMSNLLKTIMVAAVNAELGMVEVLSKFGITGDIDNERSPDPARIWEDPYKVQEENDKQIKETMGALAMEASMQQQQQEAQGAEEEAMAEEMRGTKAGAGPMGPPTRAATARGAA